MTLSFEEDRVPWKRDGRERWRGSVTVPDLLSGITDDGMDEVVATAIALTRPSSTSSLPSVLPSRSGWLRIAACVHTIQVGLVMIGQLTLGMSDMSAKQQST